PDAHWWERPPPHGPLLKFDSVTLECRSTTAPGFGAIELFGLDGAGRAVIVSGDFTKPGGKPRLTLVDLTTMKSVSSMALRRGWSSGAVHPSGVLVMLAGLVFATWERNAVLACGVGAAKV